MPGWIGVQELVVLAIVLLLLFGPKRLPEMGRSLGRGMREFKESITGGNSQTQGELAAAPARVPTASGIESDSIDS